MFRVTPEISDKCGSLFAGKPLAIYLSNIEMSEVSEYAPYVSFPVLLLFSFFLLQNFHMQTLETSTQGLSKRFTIFLVISGMVWKIVPTRIDFYVEIRRSPNLT